MFLDFFYTLRANKVPVSIREYLDLLNVVESLSGKEEVNIDKFYHLSRSVLVKDIKHYDAFDLTFSQCFKDLISDENAFKKQLDEWLKNALKKELSEERLKNALKIPPEDLIKELEKRLKEQKERHDGGNHWIGTGGTSPFGHGGFNPEGIRIGGSGGSRSALAVAGRRQYREYRTDETLNVRQIKVALKKLRILKKTGRPQLDIDKTIAKTCHQGGEIDLVYSQSRKNNLKVLLLMDVGGSMTPHSQRVEQLFSAAHQVNHFKEFKHYYFHNIFYDDLYLNADMEYNQIMSIDKLDKLYGPETRIIVVGDAYMAPYELFQMTGSLREFYYTFERKKNQKTDYTGMQRVMRLKEKFPKTIWLNPEPDAIWTAPTINAIKDIIPMYHLSLDGIQKAIKELV
jgi:uncharacterized protein with von Willebrand factor type A (vWA) domain